MADAFELADQIHVRDHHIPHEERHEVLMLELERAHALIAELRAELVGHCESYHPLEEEAAEAEAEIEEAEAEEEAILGEEAEAAIEVPEPPRVEEETVPHVDVAPKPAHWMLRRYGRG